MEEVERDMALALGSVPMVIRAWPSDMVQPS